MFVQLVCCDDNEKKGRVCICKCCGCLGDKQTTAALGTPAYAKHRIKTARRRISCYDRFLRVASLLKRTYTSTITRWLRGIQLCAGDLLLCCARDLFWCITRGEPPGIWLAMIWSYHLWSCASSRGECGWHAKMFSCEWGPRRNQVGIKGHPVNKMLYYGTCTSQEREVYLS